MSEEVTSTDYVARTDGQLGSEYWEWRAVLHDARSVRQQHDRCTKLAETMKDIKHVCSRNWYLFCILPFHTGDVVGEAGVESGPVDTP